LGAGVGFFIGSLIWPAGGGAVGIFLGNIIGGMIGSTTARNYMDKNQGIVEKMDEIIITDEEKEKSYKKACDYIEVKYDASKEHIVSVVRYLYKHNHPDKHMNKSEEIRKEFEKRFIEVHCSMGII
jgi:outer membrane lipoprotein SlyB